MLRVRTKTIPTTDCPELQEVGVETVTVRGIPYRNIDKASFEVLDYFDDVFGAERFKEIQDEARDKQTDEKREVSNPLNVAGFHAPSLVRYGLWATNHDELPKDDTERRAFVEGLEREQVVWIARQVADFNRLSGDEEEERKND